MPQMHRMHRARPWMLRKGFEYSYAHLMGRERLRAERTGRAGDDVIAFNDGHGAVRSTIVPGVDSVGRLDRTGGNQRDIEAGHLIIAIGRTAGHGQAGAVDTRVE